MAAPETPLDAAGARALMDALEAQWVAGRSEPLSSPHTLDDVEQILRRDELVLFGAGVELARTDRSLRALALEAQIELAWGEAYLLLMELMLRLQEAVEQRATDGEDARWAKEQVGRIDRIAEALQLLSIEHVARGADKADEAIAAAPDNYLGYRVAADYHRMVRDWPAFEAMEAKLEALNPDSNGLIFVRGAQAYQRDGDAAAAAGFFRRALERDPGFVRAQAHLIVIQDDLDAMLREWTALKVQNPHHQLVLLAAEVVDWLQAHPAP